MNITEAGLSIKNISAGYSKRNVLEALSIGPFRQGEIISLVGPNGAGKSTLLKSIAGLLRTTGSITFNGTELSALSARDKANTVGYMPQYMPGDIDLSVLESLISVLRASPLDAIGLQSADIRDQAIGVLEQIGIVDYALKPLSQLSGGQRQLVSFAQAIIRKPEILLLDEPTSSLDLRHQLALMKLARSYALSGKIVVIVLHDLNLASRWSDKVVVLEAGRLNIFGTPGQVMRPDVLGPVYQVKVRVEPCSNGHLQVLVDE